MNAMAGFNAVDLSVELQVLAFLGQQRVLEQVAQ